MFNFPDLPAIGDIYNPDEGPTWRWNGKAWESMIQIPSAPPPEARLLAANSTEYSTNIFYDGAYTLLNSTSVQVVGADRIYFTPFRVRNIQLFNKIGFNVSAPYTATAARLGFYTSLDAAPQYPAQLIYDAGVVEVITPGIKELDIIDPTTARGKQLNPGEYWVGILFDGECTIYGNVAPQGMTKYGSTLGPGMPIDLLFSQEHAFGELPPEAGYILREPGVFPNISLRTEP